MCSMSIEAAPNQFRIVVVVRWFYAIGVSSGRLRKQNIAWNLWQHEYIDLSILFVSIVSTKLCSVSGCFIVVG